MHYQLANPYKGSGIPVERKVHTNKHPDLSQFLSFSLKMLSNVLFAFALATSVMAAPLTESGLNSTKWTPDHILQADEVILYGEGRSEYPVKSQANTERPLMRLPLQWRLSMKVFTMRLLLRREYLSTYLKSRTRTQVSRTEHA